MPSAANIELTQISALMPGFCHGI